LPAEFVPEKPMASPGQNATVEEILASIRQAISEDDAKRTNERMRSDPRAVAERKPVASVTSVFMEKRAEPEIVEATIEGAAGETPTADSLADQQFIEQAIEQALDGVRAELESIRAPLRPTAKAAPAIDVAAASASAAQRAVPRARVATVRRETPQPRRALMSPKADAQVSGSFDDLSKAMMTGNTRKLDEAVEELLRPMLKQWLEGNLPQMVERLVREEIERVSRGGR